MPIDKLDVLEFTLSFYSVYVTLLTVCVELGPLFDVVLLIVLVEVLRCDFLQLLDLLIVR
jgi:hypothetical protein